MLQTIKKRVNNEMEDIVFKMWVHHRLISVDVVFLTHFEGCRRTAKKLRRGDRDDQRYGTASI